MPQFTVRLTPLEDKLLQHIVYDPIDWIKNLVEWRVRIAQDEYLPTAIAQLKASGATSIPSTRDEIILAANLPPKDPNWEPVLEDLPESVEYTFDIEEDDLKMLAFLWENPHVHIHEFITNRCKIAIKEQCEVITQSLITDSEWTAPIPTDTESILDLVHLVTSKEHLENTGKTTRMLTINAATQGDTMPVNPECVLFKHKEYKPFDGKDSEEGWSWAIHQKNNPTT